MEKIVKESYNKQVARESIIRSYEKPEYEVIVLETEGLICTSGYVTDPDRGEDGYWPGFNSDRDF